MRAYPLFPGGPRSAPITVFFSLLSLFLVLWVPVEGMPCMPSCRMLGAFVLVFIWSLCFVCPCLFTLYPFPLLLLLCLTFLVFLQYLVMFFSLAFLCQCFGVLVFLCFYLSCFSSVLSFFDFILFIVARLTLQLKHWHNQGFSVEPSS